MQLDKCLHDKRGCKEYTNKQIPMELLGEVIQAGTCAPSAGNLQNWAFVIVTESEKKEEIATACLNQPWMKQAPVHLIVCDKVDKITDIYPTRGKLYATQACAIAAQNIMLKATDLGLHSCWVGAFNEESIRRILHIPDEVVPEMVITLGYSDAVHDPLERESCENVTFFNTYGEKELGKSIFPLHQQSTHLGNSIREVMENKKKDQEQTGFFSKFFKRK